MILRKRKCQKGKEGKEVKKGKQTNKQTRSTTVMLTHAHTHVVCVHTSSDKAANSTQTQLETSCWFYIPYTTKWIALWHFHVFYGRISCWLPALHSDFIFFVIDKVLMFLRLVEIQRDSPPPPSTKSLLEFCTNLIWQKAVTMMENF